MKSLLIGIGISIIGILISLIVWDINSARFVTGFIGFIFIAISMIVSGSMVSGGRMRQNLGTEKPEDRREAYKSKLNIILLGIPSILTSIFLYYLIP